jgi:hypothetical protein
MRQICPNCANPFNSSEEVVRRVCNLCCEPESLASTESEASTAASSGKTSLLFRLLRHMTIINEHNRDGNGDVKPGIRLSTGVYAVPLSATQMLQVCECGHVVVLYYSFMIMFLNGRELSLRSLK